MFRVSISLLVFIFCYSTNAMTPEQFTKKSGLVNRMLRAKKMVKDLYKGKGSVVYGRIVNDPALIRKAVSRVGVSSEGYFVSEVYRGRNLCFYLHGYKPISIPATKNTPEFFNVGNISFTKLPASQTYSVQGKVKQAKSLTGNNITVSLWLAMPPQVFWDDGSSGKVNEKIMTKTITSDQTFRFNGLSPVKYRLDIYSKGSVKKQVYFNDTGKVGEYEFAGNNVGICGSALACDKPKPYKTRLKIVTLPTVTLFKAPTIRCSLMLGKVANIKNNRVPTNNTIPLVFENQIKTYERICNGTTKIPIVKRGEYYGNRLGMMRNYRLYLEVNAKNEVNPSFGFGMSRYYDLGKKTIATAKQEVNVDFMKRLRIRQWHYYQENGKVVMRKASILKREITFEDGHVYYFQYPGGNVYFLLKTDFIAQ